MKKYTSISEDIMGDLTENIKEELSKEAVFELWSGRQVGIHRGMIRRKGW